MSTYLSQLQFHPEQGPADQPIELMLGVGRSDDITVPSIEQALRVRRVLDSAIERWDLLPKQ